MMIMISRPLQAVVIAQFLSLLLTVTGVTSAHLANAGINAPTTQSFFNYLLLTIVCGSIHAWNMRAKRHASQQKSPILTNPIYIYFLLAFLDVEANTLVTSAYQYTSISSVTLLDSFTIPVVMLLSYIVFKSRYKAGHIVGAILCTSGLGLLVVSDGFSNSGGSNPILGDILVILGAIVYGICNVSQEKVLSNKTSQWELLAALGFFGSLIAGLQALLLERQMWSSGSQVKWDGSLIGAMAGFAISLFIFYLLVPQVLLLGGSAVLNLNLLTADLWAALSREFLGLGQGFDGWSLSAFLIAFSAEVVGLSLYARSGESRQEGDDNLNSSGGEGDREEARGLLRGGEPAAEEASLDHQLERDLIDKSTSSSEISLSEIRRPQGRI